jgi:uncharacterized membrane protein YfcA
VLTFFTGFGLGTILLPAFAIFLPVSLAIVATAVVHLTNNFFKLLITYKDINYRIFLLFGIPAGLASLLGAYFLVILEGFEQTIAWQIKEFSIETTLIKLIIGLLIIFFALFELITSFKKITFAKKLIPVGGAISGFFGGLSGHQGALRSAFLIKLDLSKEVFIATGVAIAVLVDVLRITIYGFALFNLQTINNSGTTDLVIVAIIGGILGAVIGKRLLKSVTLRFVQFIVSGLLLLTGLVLIFGIL